MDPRAHARFLLRFAQVKLPGVARPIVTSAPSSMQAAPGSVMHESTKPGSPASPLSSEQLRAFQQRSDGEGLLRLAGHVGAIGVAAFFYADSLYADSLRRGAHGLLSAVLAVTYGFTLVTMFAAMHESVHRTAFKTRWLNDLVGWFAGLLSFYNSTFYRYYHGWHHRFTQIRGRDPELDDPKPTGLFSYLAEMSGFHWWIGKLQTHTRIALGRVQGYPFLSDTTRPLVVRSVRLQLLVYAAAIALSVAVAEPWFVTYWLLPVALGQPLLRFILLAEHTGCSEDANPLANTRTTHTLRPVRFLMWEMPYHAEHHRYPALPFFALARVHQVLGPELVHVARRGYIGVHVEFFRSLFFGSLGPLDPSPKENTGDDQSVDDRRA
jgi:fatty acid desaturase